MSHVSPARSGEWDAIPGWPVDPADVPLAAVSYVKRTLVRHPEYDPLDDDLARVIVAGVIAVLAEGGMPGEAAAVGAAFAEATGLDVVITAAGGDR